MTMKNPPHPGEIIREMCLEPLGLTVTQAAQGLGVTRKTLSLLVNGHAGISPEVRLKEGAKLGFRRAMLAQRQKESLGDFPGLELMGVETLAAAIRSIFP
jgi:addiction module HigA family antidote